MRESRDPAATGLDWPGAASFTAALALLTYGFLKAPEAGWSDPAVVGLLAGAVLFFTVFGIVERRAARPMLDLSLFRYPRFVGVQLLAAAPAYAFVVLLVLLPVRFVGVEGMGEIAAGRLMIALSAPLLVLPLVAGWLTRWLPASVLCAGGLVVSAAGLFWLSGVPAGAPATALVLPMLTIGIGISLPWGLMDGLAVSVVPTERAGMATGIFNTTRVAGEGLALAVVGAVLSALTVGHLAGAGLGPSESRVAAAQRLVTGDLAAAQQLLPESGHDQLVAQYGLAFSSLLVVLTVVTLITAVVVFLFMGRKAGEEVVAEVAEA